MRLYQQESFVNLTLAHFWLVAVSSVIAIVLGTGAGIAVTRPAGREFRPLVETIAATGQTFPPVAVLAIAVPAIGFGQEPAIIALILYGVLPILQGTLAGIAAVPASVLSVAEGMGMSAWQRLVKVELPLAAPVIVARTIKRIQILCLKLMPSFLPEKDSIMNETIARMTPIH